MRHSINTDAYNKFKIRGVGRPKKAKTALFFVPSYISELLLDSSDESDDDNEADAAADVVAADVVAAADNATDVDENTGDDASDLETEPTVPKTSTTEKVAVPKTSKKRGPRGPYKKKIQQ